MSKSVELINDDDNLSIHKGETHGLSKQKHVLYQNNSAVSDINMNLKVDHLSF